MSSDPQRTFTGLDRRRKTSWTVTAGDRIARSLVAVGGIGTIGAVLLVCVFLVSEVVPLFVPAKVESTHMLPGAIANVSASHDASRTVPPPVAKAGPPIRLGMDEFGLLGWALFADGQVRCFRLDDGHLLNDLSPEQAKLAGMTAMALSTDGQQAIFGFRDGKLQTGRIGFDTRFIEPDKVPAAVRDMAVGATAEWDGGLVGRIPTGQYRRQKLIVKLDEPILAGGKGEPSVRLADHVEPAGGSVFCWLDGNGKLQVASVETRHDLLAGEDESTLSSPAELKLPADAKGPPQFLRLSGLGDYAYVAWNSGRLLRYEIRDLDHPRLMEDVHVVDEPGVSLTVLEPLLGGTTLLAGDSSGRVRAWFPRPADRRPDRLAARKRECPAPIAAG